LSLNKNDLEVIEFDLFKYNPEIKLFRAENNKFKHIDVDTFKSLKKLEDLELRNRCADKFANNANTIASVLSTVKQRCVYSSDRKKSFLRQKIEALKTEIFCYEQTLSNSDVFEVGNFYRQNLANEMRNRIGELRTAEILLA
jgi:Asp-tRNA(Asn)/Glu-tRNA(Gln) amidotransferase C subunit